MISPSPSSNFAKSLKNWWPLQHCHPVYIYLYIALLHRLFSFLITYWQHNIQLHMLKSNKLYILEKLLKNENWLIIITCHSSDSAFFCLLTFLFNFFKLISIDNFLFIFNKICKTIIMNAVENLKKNIE